MKIAEIKELLANNPNEELLAELAKDGRSGVQKLVAACRNLWLLIIKNSRQNRRSANALPKC